MPNPFALERAVVLPTQPSFWIDVNRPGTLFTGNGSQAVNGSSVGRVMELSGNGLHPTQLVTSRQPTLSISSGYKELVFDGSNDWLDIRQFPIFPSGNADLSMYFVYRPTLLGETDSGALLGNYPTGCLGVYISRLAGYGSPFGVWNNAEVNLSGDSYVSEKTYISIVRSSGSFTGWYKGVQKNTVANSNSVYTGASTSSIWRIGDNTTDSAGENFRGSIMEIICFPVAHNSTQRQAVESYLAARHSI